MPPPEQLAATALLVATDEASHMYGVYMIADGGYSMLEG
jgi:3-oxoacyl-[acyl-carrier protein] reductase